LGITRKKEERKGRRSQTQISEREGGGGWSIKRKRKKTTTLTRWRVVFLTRGKARAAETEQNRYGALQFASQ
jgi:hypothetical protein